MTSAFKIIELQQDTDEWLQWRWSGLGSSDAPTIMKQNPWKSRGDLFEERLAQKTPVQNRAMLEGKKSEPLARKSYIEKVQTHAKPACLQSEAFPFMLASLDGINLESGKVVEIKCGKSSYQRSLGRGGFPPPYYIAQLQHILAVTGFEQIDYFSWRPDQPPLLRSIDRDEEFINQLVDNEASFWKRLLELKSELDTI
ncbi:lambda-exonuclease family protein [Parasphingorhabdus sp.]|uniref:lambda-exonuclease family protein n=1 Tax=Parasphingorhabdus sp. TaxID=2709688 RepID=UPI003A940115